MALRLLTSLSIAYSAALIPGWGLDGAGVRGEVLWGWEGRERESRQRVVLIICRMQIHNKFPRPTKPGRDD